MLLGRFIFKCSFINIRLTVMKLKILFGILFCLLALLVIVFYPTRESLGYHVKVAYSFSCLFVGAYFLSKGSDSCHLK
jgi:hypothetical protein